MTALAVAVARPALLRRALNLEYLTVGWNLIEGLIAVTAALAAGSVALLGFGIDSFLESASGSIIIWRILAERAQTDAEAIVAHERGTTGTDPARPRWSGRHVAWTRDARGHLRRQAPPERIAPTPSYPTAVATY